MKIPLSVCVHLLCATLICFSPPSAHADDRLSIVVAATPEGISGFEHFTQKHGFFTQKYPCINCCKHSRPVASLIVITQALAEGGLPVDIEFMQVPNTARMRMAISLGEAVIGCQDLFSSAFEEEVFMSGPVIPEGTFVKGIYTRENNAQLMQVTTLEQLRAFRVVSSTAWKVDWATLRALEFGKMRSVPRKQLMFSLIDQGEADFALLEFPYGDDLSLYHDGKRFVPVPGIKLSLMDSRHFMVSRKHPDGRTVFDALQRGLVKLRRQGQLKHIYTAAGFYNPAVADWKLLNPPQ